MDKNNVLKIAQSAVVPEGWKLVPIEPTEDMVTHGFESCPDPFFSKPEDWDSYEEMTGCQKAAHRARLCWAAMLAAAPSVSASQTANLTDERIVELYRDSFNAMVGRMREAPKHVPPTVLEFARSIEKEIRTALPSQSEPADRLPGAVQILIRAGHSTEEARALINESASAQSEPVSADAAQEESAKERLLARFPSANANDVSNWVRHWWVIYLDQSGRNLAGDGSTEAEAWRNALAFIEHEDRRANVASPVLTQPRASKDIEGNYLTGDDELDLLLGLTDDMATGRANMDTGLWWHSTLEKIKARLALTQPSEQAQAGDKPVMKAPVPARPILYTDTISGEQCMRDDMWAVTTDELNALSASQQASERDKLDAQLWACNQETGKEFLIKSGTLSEMMAEMERMNAQGHDYFIRSAARAAQEKKV